MPAIRISPRLLVTIAALAALCAGLVVGEFRHVNSAAAAPVAQAAPTALNQDLSMRLMQAAVAAASQANVKESFSIVDANGNELMMVHGDGANFFTSDIARGKANATAAFGVSGAAWAQSLTQNPGFWGSLSSLGRPLVTAQGSLPIMIDGVRVVAMGASGGSGQQDEDFVRAAFNAVGLTTP